MSNANSVAAEEVLVVPTSLFRSLGDFQGFSPDVRRYTDILLAPGNFSFRPRGEVEKDPSWKQIIPYVLLSHRAANTTDTMSFFSYRRGQGAGEARLRKLKSLGIGGHVSREDTNSLTDGWDICYEAMRREIDEEVIIDTSYTERSLGMINDDATEVGRVHLGVVILRELTLPNVRPRESDLVETHFNTVANIIAERDQYESWSALCIDALCRGEWQ